MNMLNSRSCRILMTAVIIGSANSQALAADDFTNWTADEIVITATRTENPVSKLPMAVEVITREQIAESGALNLADVLAEAEDVNALEPVNGRIGVAKLRGLDSSLTLVLIDGYRLQSGFQGYSDLREIPAGMIERIEIVRGSGSALYGSDAVGGVINVITRKPTKELHGGLSVSGGGSRYGEAGTVESDGWLSGSAGKLGYVVAGTYYNRDRYDRDKSDLMTDGDDRRIASGSASLTYDLTPGVKLTGGIVYADNSLDGIRTQTSGDFDRWVDSDRLLVHVGAEIKTGEESNLSLQVARSTYDWSSLMDNLNGVPVITSSTASGTTTTTATTTTTRTKVSQDYDQFDARWTGRFADHHRLTAGVEYRTEERTDSGSTVTTKVVTKTGAVNSGPTTMVTPDKTDSSHDVDNLGLYFQDEFTGLKPLSIIAGVRYDDHSDFGSEFSPKVAALLPISSHIKLRASYGEGFRAPSIYELCTGSLTTKKSIVQSNPNLEAETSQTFEIGSDYTNGRFKASVTAFRNEVRNMISQVQIGVDNGIPVNQYQNISRAMTRGIEINASMKLSSAISISDRVSFLDSEDMSTGKVLLYVPDIANVFRLDYLNGRLALKGNIRIITTGTQHVSDIEKISGYTLVNGYLSKRVARNTELFVGVDNLFNDDANAAYGNNEGSGAMGTYYYGGLNFKL
ncbi:TonB-dependent siderophore receptor [Chlorobaculum sp. 24CR]|uniref:TonB-dependent receptor plug domain-containing protein n=1 Tax=Chlorobaculum sp. 24CR TaxID=2508878 RepID=UPI001431E8AC|nr:TonB-dependent receptor [Chlorobaculum sp. 24CR]